MSSSSTLTRLGTRNTFRASGRLLILTLLLASAVVARATSNLSQAGLTAEAVAALSPEARAMKTTVVVYSPNVSYTPRMLDQFFHQMAGWGWWQPTTFIKAECDRYWGPGGLISLVRPAPEVDVRGLLVLPDSHPEREWYTSIEGRYPTDTGEVAIPKSLAATAGLRVGDLLTLLPVKGDPAPVSFEVTGIYTPAGTGPVYDYVLSTLGPVTADEINVNMIIGPLDPRAVNAARSWGGPNAAEVTEFAPPEAMMASLARSVYSTQSKATTVGFALVGVAVLVVLLVAMVERRREAAIYKMVGLDSVATLRVLGTELAWSLLLAFAAAAPVYWLAATRYVLDVHAATASVIAPPFLTSAAWTVAVAVLGAIYPFALASVGTPNQLLTKQKIYIFRRKQVLRGWAGGDVE